MGGEEGGRSRIVCSTRLVRPFKHATPVISEEEEKEKRERERKKISSSEKRSGKILIFPLWSPLMPSLSLFFFYSERRPLERDKSAQSRGQDPSKARISPGFHSLGQENTILPPSSTTTTTTIIHLRIFLRLTRL